MALKNLVAAAMIFAGAAGMALAANDPVKLGLGNQPSDPEKVGKIGSDLIIRARLIREKSGELAAKVKKGEVVRVDLDFLAVEGAKDRPMSVVCSAQFIDVTGKTSESSISGKPCGEGRIGDGYGRYVDLDFSLRFRPETGDPAGTNGVVIRVEDSYSGKTVALVPTYDWVDGTK
jgi:hypothetical protein